MLVDSHCHLDFPDFSEDIDNVVRRARAAGINRIVTICTRVNRFNKVRMLAQRYDDVFCSVGTHPHNVDEEPDVTSHQLMSLSDHPKVVAIGESGLDFHYEKSLRASQRRSFLLHIDAARQTGLPLVIHSRNADSDMIRILDDENADQSFSAVLHCFSSSLRLAECVIDLGLYISFSGILTFKNSQNICDIASNLPKNRVILETDSPYLTPVPKRGERNEPSFTIYTAKVLAKIWKVESEDVWRMTTDNFFNLFSKVPR
ncbi:TatD family hydrolase [Candidatus Endowatersipora endosymbiont of Watersipora subatra]|uniref:TatD family hydrolase n=1 Tax=Candidatus Endowatersipora endosymbiont of Watersipora subatra TaxID=3077946 RepID=UPI00312C7FE0